MSPAPPGAFNQPPQQPGYPIPPQPTRSHVGAILGIIAGVVVVAGLAVGLAVHFLTGDDEKKAHGDGQQLAAGTFQFAPERAALWKSPIVGTSGVDSDSVGQWTTATSVIVGDHKEITSFDIKTGKRQWVADTPLSGAVPCTMSDSLTADGRGAILYRKPGLKSLDPCTLLAVIDTQSGDVQWHKDIFPSAEDGEYSKVGIDQKTKRVFAIAANRVFSYNLDNGRQNWAAGKTEFCNLSGQISPKAIIVEQSCVDGKTVVASLDPAVGGKKVHWEYTVGESGIAVAILSAEPPVAVINPGNAIARGTILGFTASGKPGRAIPLSQPFGKFRTTGVTDSVFPYAFKGNTMYATLSEGSGKEPAWVAAYDLSSGQEKWHQHVNNANTAVQILGFDGTSLLVARESAYPNKGRLLHLALDSGVITQGGALPSRDADSLSINRIMVKGNLLFVVNHFGSSYGPRLIALGPVN